jgi:hypothetical protein
MWLYAVTKNRVEKEFNKTIKYNALLKYSVRQFQSKVKFAIKSLVKKRCWGYGYFQKKFSQIIQELVFSIQLKYQHVNLYFQDKKRFGLFTKNGKALILIRVKPIYPFHQVFKPAYLFGAFSPINSCMFLLELPFCNNDTFQ